MPQLNRLGVENKEVTLFVASEEEESKYRSLLPADVTIIVGELGIGRQRKFINNFFPKGDRIVSVDDDVELVQKADNKIKPLETPLPELADRAFSLCEETGAQFLGHCHQQQWIFPEASSGVRSQRLHWRFVR